MNSKSNLFLSLIFLMAVAALYRVIPDRPMGFAPQLSMALFAGAVIRNRAWAFAFPIFSLFISDLIYHALYLAGDSSLWGFYEGQFTNYLLFATLTGLGFLIRKITAIRVAGFSVLSSTLFYLASNFFVWINGGGFARPKTWEGLMLCYTDGLPFYLNSLMGTLAFSALLFGCWKLLAGKQQAWAVAGR